MVARIAWAGLVAGIDVSDVMVRRARRRNASAVADGRVDLRRGTVSGLPDFGAPFDGVFAVNTFHYWTDPERGLADVLRVLRPGGTVAIAEQPRSARAGDDRTREPATVLAGRLRAAGFAVVTVELLPREPGGGRAGEGVKP